MRIERVIICGLRALDARDDAWVDPDGVAQTAGCLRGLNGSGKTTYLEAIAELWQWFRRCTQRRRFADFGHLEMLSEARMVAVLFSGLPPPRPRMWIAAGHPEALKSLPDGPENPFVFDQGAPVWDTAVLTAWDEAFTRAELGSDRPPPNVVMISAEEKWVPRLAPEDLENPRPTPTYQPVARYLPRARGASHLEPLIRTLFLARRAHWDLLARYVGELRPGLELLDRFDEATQRPIFRLDSGVMLDVHRLSAGERSLLINLCMVLRWLARGGVVLLDEPELHQHVSLMSGSLAVLHEVIGDRLGGQIIAASHAPEVWEYFRRAGALIDLGASG